MKFKKYLKEAIIQPSQKDLKMIRKIMKKAFEKWNDDGDFLEDVLEDAIKEFDRYSKDLVILFKDSGGKSSGFGGAEVKAVAGMMGAEQAGKRKHYIQFKFSFSDAYNSWLREKGFQYWLDQFMDVAEHELVHIEQYRKLLKIKKDPKKVSDILGGIHARQRSVVSKSGTKGPGDLSMDGYLSSHLEIMAHAKHAEAELKHIYKARDVIEFMKNPDDLDDIAVDSAALFSYYETVKDNYPKTWKKFIKYLYMFLEKRMKKEEKKKKKKK